MTNLTPLATQERITDAVFQKLRSAILNGDLAPGTKLSVPVLAQELNVSRSPVREAVQRLTTERLAYEEPRRGCFVVELDADDLIPIYDVREVLEGLAARRAAELRDPACLERLEALMSSHRAAIQAGDLERHVALDVAFHELLREVADNQLLTEVLDSIRGVVQLAIRTTSLRTGPGHLALAEHERIVEAIVSGDAVAAETEARHHIARMRQTLREQISSRAGADTGESALV
jgi:DNA-binding GntR family transcriptional regulator